VILTNAAPDKSARQTILGYFHHGRRSSRMQKNGSNLQSIANLIRFFNLRQSFFPISFLCLELKFVMKNAALSQNVNLTVT